ncbi:MAG: T9SS type A sorting domain-containing protein [Saprospiraceae bacterium]
MRYVVLSFLLWVPLAVHAQPSLLPHIGLASPPLADDPICSIPVYQGNMYQSGYAEQDTVHDFTLYTLSGDSVRLHDELMKGKPVLLVGANYTCPVWRGKINVLNEMTEFYANQLSVFVVYTVEAHPTVDISPYSGQVWTTSANEVDGVLYPQPKTYGERLDVVEDMINDLDILPTILVDGPCNEWWSHYGPAPNNAYLIRPDGTVSAKHGWFHRHPDNMWCDIDSLLATNSGFCTQNGNQGTFALTLDDGDSLAIGQPGDILSIHTTIHNLSSTDNVQLRIKKAKVDVPKSWQTALCADICYATDVEETDIVIGPDETQPFIFYFYTDLSPDSGFARVQFINLQNGQNKLAVRFFGITEVATSVGSPLTAVVRTYPNPADQQIVLEWAQPTGNGEWSMMDIRGQSIDSGELSFPSTAIEVGHLPEGTYILHWQDGDGRHGQERVVILH